MSSADRENERAGELIERLLVDPEFRAEFRRDPAAACVAAGLPDLAAELAGSARVDGHADDSRVEVEPRRRRDGGGGRGMSVAEAQALIQHGPAGAPRGNLSHGGALRDPLGARSPCRLAGGAAA